MNPVTPDGTSGWKYKNYVTMGSYENKVTAFSRLAKVDSGGTETGEVLDYLYDGQGRLANAMFAQTFPSGNTALAPTSRAVAHYEYFTGFRKKSEMIMQFTVLFLLSFAAGYFCTSSIVSNIAKIKKYEEVFHVGGQIDFRSMITRSVQLLTWQGVAIVSVVGIACTVSTIVAPKPEGAASIPSIFAQHCSATFIGILCGSFVSSIYIRRS